MHVLYEQSLLGRDNEAGAQIQVVYPPSCQLSLRVKLETFIIECQPRGNPKNFTFSWRKNNLTFSDFSHVSSGEASNHGKDQKITLLYLLILESFNFDIDAVLNTQYFKMIILHIYLDESNFKLQHFHTFRTFEYSVCNCTVSSSKLRNPS